MATRRGTGSIGPQPIQGTDGRVPLNFYRNQYEQLLNNVAIPNQNFDASATMPIPGLTGPKIPPAGMTPVPGLPSSGGTQYQPPPFSSAFQPAGPYAMLAQQMAGQRPQMPPGMGAAPMMPGQPGQQHPLRPPPGGFRIPRGK